MPRTKAAPEEQKAAFAFVASRLIEERMLWKRQAEQFEAENPEAESEIGIPCRDRVYYNYVKFVSDYLLDRS